jgi:bifunctional DNA-binding transcriptional regulator/antitoxin component of YhaV-PrlF toxin-antitoxin module
MSAVKTLARSRTRRRGVTRISSKNQVTLPIEALRKAGLRPGAELRVEADGAGRLVLTSENDPIRRYAGIFRYPKGYLKKLRSEWRY